MGLMGFIRQLHLYAGLVLSVLLLLLAVTGGALVYKHAWWRAVYPELRGPAPAVSAGDQARAIAEASDRFGEALTLVKMPEPGVPAYHLYLREGEALLSPGELDVIDRWGSGERLMSVLFELHHDLMAGPAGEQIVAVLGIAGTLMAITGLVIWWPARRRFSLAHLWPHGWTRRDLVRWHRDLGVVFTPLLLVLMLTGSGLVWYGTATKFFHAVLPGSPVHAAAPSRAAETGVPLPDEALLARVQGVFPEARLVFFYPPPPGEAILRFRLRQPCEWHPNGLSFVYADARTGEIVESRDACSAPAGDRAVQSMYPLHAGKTGGPVYKFVSFLGALALGVLSVTGVMTYAIRLLRRRKRA